MNQTVMAQWYSTHCLIVSQASPVDVYLSALTAFRSGDSEECERILRTYPVVAPSSPFQLHETALSIEFYRQREHERVQNGKEYSSHPSGLPTFPTSPESAANSMEKAKPSLVIETFPLDQDQMLLPTDPRDLFYGVFLLLQCLISQKKWKDALDVLGETSETSLEAVLQTIQELLLRSERMPRQAYSEAETGSEIETETDTQFAPRSNRTSLGPENSDTSIYNELTIQQSVTALCSDAAFLSPFHSDFFPPKAETSEKISSELPDSSISMVSLLSLYRAQIYTALEQPPLAAFWAKKAFELDYRNVQAFQLLCTNHYESNEKLVAMVYEQDPAPQFSWLLPLYLSLIPSLNLTSLEIKDEDDKDETAGRDEDEDETEDKDEIEMAKTGAPKTLTETEEYEESEDYDQESAKEDIAYNNFSSQKAAMMRKKKSEVRDFVKSSSMDQNNNLHSDMRDVQSDISDIQRRQGGMRKRQNSRNTSQTMLSRILATVNQVQIVGTVVLPYSRHFKHCNQKQNKHSRIFRYGVFFDRPLSSASPTTRFPLIRYTTTGCSLQFSPSIVTSLASYLYHTSNYTSCSRLCRLVFLSPVAYLYTSNSDVIQYYACSLALLSSSTIPLSSSLPSSSISFKSSYGLDSTGIGIGVGLGSESTSPSAELHSLARTLVQRDPQNPTSWYVAALSQFSTGSASVVRKLLLKAVTLQPSFSPAWLLFGHTFARQGESSQALSAYRMAVAAAPYAAAPLLSQAQELVATSSSVSSSMNSTNSLTFELTLYPVLNILENAMLLSQNDPFILHEKGIVLYSLQRFQEASLVFQIILELSSKKRIKKGKIDESSTSDLTHHGSQNFAILDTVLSSLGHTYRKMKKYKDAAHIFERALIIAPSKTSIRVSLGFTYHLMGAINEAIDQYQAALNANPQDSFVAALMQRAIAFTVTYTEIDELIPKRRRHGHVE